MLPVSKHLRKQHKYGVVILVVVLVVEVVVIVVVARTCLATEECQRATKHNNNYRTLVLRESSLSDALRPSKILHCHTHASKALVVKPNKCDNLSSPARCRKSAYGNHFSKNPA